MEQNLSSDEAMVLSTETYAIPISPSQERFWSLDQLPSGNAALNMPLMWRCSGPLNAEALRSAFQFCVQRHESLRTTFELLDGELRQVIHPYQAVEIPVVDLSGLKGETQRLEADRITREHAAYPFDLRKGPLLALRLVVFNPQSHLLLVTMHHIICDGISNGVLMRDMVAVYESLVAGTSLHLPELPIQYADFTEWQRTWLESADAEKSLEYWRDSIGNDFTQLRLPHDLDAPSALPKHLEGSTGQIETLLVPPDLTRRAQQLCAKEGVTFNVFFFAAFAALLSRLTGQKNFTIGSPCANRMEDTEELVGLFMNIQVLRVRMEESTSFQQILQSVNDWTLRATENQLLPFEKLVEDPFFQEGEGSMEIPIFFLYQPSFMLTYRIPSPQGSLQIVPLRSESPGAIFDLMMAVVDRAEEGPRLQLEYNPQQYKSSTIQRYLHLFVNLIESAVKAPQLPVSELSLLTQQESVELQEHWNHTAVDFGPFVPMHLEFLRQAQAHPAQTALICANERWSYAQLERRARAVGGALLQRGIKPGDHVSLCVARSADMLAAMLGILMIGAAYVPLDPRFPVERLQHAVQDSDTVLVITDRNLGLSDMAHLGLDAAVACTELLQQPYQSAPDDLAYIIYTSGSTGTPKGVAIQHASLTNLLRSMQQEPGLSTEDTLVAITTLSFDIATMELLLPLFVGAKVVIATENEARATGLLLKLLVANQATVLQATPGMWRALLDEEWPSSLRLKILCGGEAMSRDLADKMLAHSDDVWNMYGPTETTIWSSATRVTHDVRPPRLGHPIANTSFYVLDSKRQLVPIGMEGELCIGGAGLARGYYNRAALTEEKFIALPFGEGRLYCTGDLARRDEDGGIQLIGRSDFQIKVRGYRIELGEIENKLEQHSLVREAIVVHSTTQNAHDVPITRLIAYVDVGSHADENGNAALITELEEYIGRSLPEHMMPNVLVALPEFPRLINGKVNRKALPPVLEKVTAASDVQDFQPPRDALERQLAELWQTMLGIPRISTTTSFFSLGVGSLAALRLITRINRVFAMDLGLASLVATPTIESIARLIHQRFSTGRTSALVPMKTTGTGAPLFILHGVGGNIINFFGLSRRLTIDRPVYGIQAQSLLSKQSALLRLEDMAAYYIREIRSIQPHGPYFLFGYSFGGSVAFEMAQQLHASGEEIALLGMLDARTLDFERHYSQSMTVQTKVERRFERLFRNTSSLSWSTRASYIYDKLKTRGIRWSSTAAAAAGMRRMPAWLKSSYDINYVALRNYTPKPFSGRLDLFRATEQDYAAGPRDLGWQDLFTQGVRIHEIPGDHERIFLEPSLEKLVTEMSRVVEAASEAYV